MVDKSTGEIRLQPALPALGRCAAVFGGALIALLSLLQHTPVWVASLRGGLTWFVLAWVSRLGMDALAKVFEADAAQAQAKEESE